MDDTNGIQIEEQNVSSAITWGIISGIYIATISFFMGAVSPLILSPNEVFRDGLRTIYPLLYLSEWVVTIATTVWVVIIAKKLNRSTVLWGLCGFLFPPITLIVIGFQDYRIADKNIRKIVNDMRMDFETELLHIKSTDDLSKEELNAVEIKLKEKFNLKIKDRISGIGFDEKRGSGNIEQVKSEEQEIVEMEKEEDEVVQSVAHKNWTSEISKCPACGASVNENATECPECGLTLN